MTWARYVCACKTRSYGVIQLHQHNECDAPVSIEYTEKRAKSVERLGNHNAALDGFETSGDGFRLYHSQPHGADPAPVERESGKKYVEPVDHQSRAVRDEFSQHGGGKRHDGDGGQKQDMHPGKAALRALQIIQLRLLADPENAEREKTHQVHQQPRRNRNQAMPKIALAMDGFNRGRAQIKHKQRHGDGKDAVTQGGKPLHALAGDPIVSSVHVYLRAFMFENFYVAELFMSIAAAILSARSARPIRWSVSSTGNVGLRSPTLLVPAANIICMTGRPEPNEAAPYYFGYINRVSNGDIVHTLQNQLDEMLPLLHSVSEEKSLYRYAPDKWSIRQMWNHVNDAERIFLYRALWFARGHNTALPSFEQDIAVAAGKADDVSWANHVEEFRVVRLATLSFFRNLPQETWLYSGIASGNPFSVRACAYIVAGHVAHHAAVLHEKYS